MKSLLLVLLFASPLCAQILTVPNGGIGRGILTAHGPLIGNGTAPITVGSPGTAGQCWLSGGSSADPSFQACPSGGGGGSVNSFSAGNLAPLFTTSVATATTTPALTFTLSNAAANSIFGNFTGAGAAPSFNVMSACGDATHALNWTSGTGFGCQALSGGGGMVYPGAGIANSTGAAWGTSYSAGNTIPANFVSTLNQNTTGNAATATALASAPTICTAGQYAQGIIASGNATGCSTPSSSPLNPVANISGTYNATAADFQNCAMKYSATGAVAVNLVANTSQPANGQCMIFLNYSTGGTITINRNGQNINGGTGTIIVSAAVNAVQPSTATVWSDGTNYFSTRVSSTVAFAAVTGGTAVSQAFVIGSSSTLGFSGTGAIVSPVVNTGVAQGSGLKHQRVASCTTTAAVNGNCAANLTWTTAFADANYTVSCSSFSSPGAAVTIVGKTASVINLVFYNIVGLSGAVTGEIDCIAMHD